MNEIEQWLSQLDDDDRAEWVKGEGDAAEELAQGLSMIVANYLDRRRPTTEPIAPALEAAVNYAVGHMTMVLGVLVNAVEGPGWQICGHLDYNQEAGWLPFVHAHSPDNPEEGTHV